MLTNCIFSKSRHGLWMWWMRLCLYRRLELMARLSFRSSKGRSSKWGSSLQGRVSFIQGGGLVDLRGLCTWFGGVVENSTGGVASLPRKWKRRRKIFRLFFHSFFFFSLSNSISNASRCDLIECTWFIDWIINGRYCKKGECYFLQSTNYIGTFCREKDIVVKKWWCFCKHFYLDSDAKKNTIMILVGSPPCMCTGYTMARLRHILIGRNGDYFLNYIDYSNIFDAVLKLLLVF